MAATKNPKNVAIYARVSSDGQRERRTIESQLTELPEYAQAQGYRVVDTYSDNGISGSTIDARPGFKRLLADAARRRFEAILVCEHNRLTRSDNPEEMGRIQRILMENNIRIISPAEGVLDLRRPPDELIAWIRMWISKEERKEIVRKTRRGKLNGLKKGIWTCGKHKFGYRRDSETKKTVVNREERDLYRSWVDTVLAGGSANGISRDLNDRGVRTKSGCRWWNVQVTNVLRDRTYFTGKLVANKVKEVRDPMTGKSRKTQRPKADWIEVSVPKLIAQEKWKLLQKRLNENRSAGRRSQKPRNLLKGILKCGHCGANLIGRRGTDDRFWYYACNNRSAEKHKRTTLNGRKCYLPPARALPLERVVMNYVSRVISDPEFVSQQLLSHELGEGRSSELKERGDELKGEIKRQKERMKKVLDLYVDDKLLKPLLDEKAEDIHQAIERLSENLNQVEHDTQRRLETRLRKDQINQELKNLKRNFGRLYDRTALQTLDFHDKRSLLKAFFESANDYITVFENTEPDGFAPTFSDMTFDDVRLNKNHDLRIGWRSIIQFDLMKQAARKIGHGVRLADALEMARKDILEVKSLPARPTPSDAMRIS